MSFFLIFLAISSIGALVYFFYHDLKIIFDPSLVAHKLHILIESEMYFKTQWCIDFSVQNEDINGIFKNLNEAMKELIEKQGPELAKEGIGYVDDGDYFASISIEIRKKT